MVSHKLSCKIINLLAACMLHTAIFYNMYDYITIATIISGSYYCAVTAQHMHQLMQKWHPKRQVEIDQTTS